MANLFDLILIDVIDRSICLFACADDAYMDEVFIAWGIAQCGQME